jgi:Ca2+/H+ antiporter, TMEM165/GDT1 family
MKFRRRPSPVLLLLIPAISSILVSANPGATPSDISKDRAAREAKALSPTATIPLGQLSLKPTSKVDVGTKDAPVDGKDGKPHAGPFVDYEKDRKKPTSGAEDGELVTKKTTLKNTGDERFPDGRPIPEVNDGVMNDPSRELPRQGTTGTEGGVSEKDKARKAQEGQTGEKLEKKPDSPKEAPPLPHSEIEKINKGEKDAAKQAKTKGKDNDADDASDLLGLEAG